MIVLGFVSTIFFLPWRSLHTIRVRPVTSLTIENQASLFVASVQRTSFYPLLCSRVLNSLLLRTAFPPPPQPREVPPNSFALRPPVSDSRPLKVRSPFSDCFYSSSDPSEQSLLDSKSNKFEWLFPPPLLLFARLELLTISVACWAFCFCHHL